MTHTRQCMMVMGALATVMCACARGAETPPADSLLRDGFHIQGQDGTLVLDTNTGDWSFRFDADLFDGQHTADRRTLYHLLPTSGSEALVQDHRQRTTLAYQLWAKVTQYRGSNYLYVTHFLPLRKAPSPAPVTAVRPGTETPEIDPNDPLRIPAALERDHHTRRLVAPPAPQEQPAPKPDGLLLDRVGYVAIRDGRAVFVLDGLGRRLNARRLTLLPNRMLDTLQQQQTAALERIHVRVVGLITRYQGQEHLLLLRAIPVHHYGNFGR